ncbi:MAG: hypothetical protein IJX58_07950 [Clostridia bacterium]|nr:hypothetical protein [Clostridia bacterium]
MTKFTKPISACIAIVLVLLCVLPITAFASGNSSNAPASTNIDNFTIHNMADNSGYYPTDKNAVDTLSSGHKRLGTLSVIGNVQRKSYNGFEAYAVYGGNVSFEYNQKWSDKTVDGKTWKLSSDTSTSISGIDTGSIKTGGLIVLKSVDNGSTWVHTGAKSVDINDSKITFTPDSSDIKSGVLYKFISVCEAAYEYTYKSGTKTKYPSYWDAPWYIHAFGGPAAVGIWVAANSWEEPVYSTAHHYENFAQVSVVYLASDSCEVGFYSSATENYDISGDFDDVDAKTVEILNKGLTLTNGSISFDKIRLDKLGNKSFDVTYSYNSSEYKTAKDGQVFTNPGNYKFRIKTKFGTQRTVELWIVDLGSDMAYSKYFGDSFVSQDKRVFDKTSQLPVYMVGTKLSLTPESNLPGITGSIYRYEDAAAVESEEYEIVHSYERQTESTAIYLNETGIYCADLYVGDLNACGEIIHYSFYFVITDNPDYKPTVNLELLTSSDRHLMMSACNYAVSFSTAGGGSYVFMFPATDEGYDQALAFAEEIEYRFIEEYVDQDGSKYWYYRDKNSSVKTRYDSKVELFGILSEHVYQNAKKVYINSTESYGTMSLDEAIANIENTSIKNDIRVCIDEETRNKLVTPDIIVNGYTFFQAAAYETDGVTATDENGNVYNLPYDTPIETVLPSTGRYLITETNWHSTNSYYVNYLADGDVTGYIDFAAIKDFSSFTGKISSESSGSVIEANSITFLKAEDKYDSQTIVTVSKVGERKSQLLTEIDNYTVSEPGDYTVTITNRLGNQTSVTVKITEAPGTLLRFAGNEAYNCIVKHGEKLGTLPELNVYGYNFKGWTANGEYVNSDTLCKWTEEVVLEPVLEAKKVKVILYHFNGLITENVEFGATIQLNPASGIESYFTFAYWSLDDQAVEELTVNTVDDIMLVAKYHLVDPAAINLPGDTVYSTSEIPEVLSSFQPVPTPEIPSVSDGVDDNGKDKADTATDNVQASCFGEEKGDGEKPGLTIGTIVLVAIIAGVVVTIATIGITAIREDD